MKPYAGIDFERNRGLAKKDVENCIVTDVLSRIGLSHFRLIDEKTQESPDAIVEFCNWDRSCQLACEVRSLSNDASFANGSAMRRFRSQWMEVAEKVRARLAEDDTYAVPYCVVEFRRPTYECLDGICLDSLADELATVGRMFRSVSNIEFPQESLSVLSDAVCRIRVLDRNGQGRLWWPSHMQSGSIEPLNDAVVDAVREKTAKAGKYDWRNATERWLLLVAEAHGVTDVFSEPREVRLPNEMGNLPFTRVVIWDRFSESIWSIFPRFEVFCNGHTQQRFIDRIPPSLWPYGTGDERYPTRPMTR